MIDLRRCKIRKVSKRKNEFGEALERDGPFRLYLLKRKPNKEQFLIIKIHSLLKLQ